MRRLPAALWLTTHMLVFCCLNACDDGGKPCVEVGGSCVAVSSCGVGQGYLAKGECTGTALTCCLPLTACGGTEDFVCCSTTASFRPLCDGGQLVCSPGLTKADGMACP